MQMRLSKGCVAERRPSSGILSTTPTEPSRKSWKQQPRYRSREAPAKVGFWRRATCVPRAVMEGNQEKKFGKSLPGTYNFGDNYMWGADGIRQQNASMAAMGSEWEPAVEAFWESVGASPTQTLRLVNVGAKWQPDTPLTRVYRDPELLSTSMFTLACYVPGAELCPMLQNMPSLALLGLRPEALTSRLAEIRRALPDVDLAVMLESPGGPEILVGVTKQGEQIPGTTLAAARDVIHRLLPALNMRRLLETYPRVLLYPKEDLENGVAELARMYPGHDDRQLAIVAGGDPERIVRPHLRMGLR